MRALNVPANIYASLLQAVQLISWEYYACSCQLIYTLVHYKWCSQSAGNIMHTPIMPANIYPSPLKAVQLIGWEYYACSNHASQHISYSATSSAADWLGILCTLQSCQLTYILFCYKQCS